MANKYAYIDMPSLSEMTEQLGYDKKGAVQIEATRLAKEFMDDNVPSDTTDLRQQAEARGTEVVYGPPGTSSNKYANIVYGGVRNGVPMNFQGAPQRGADWDDKMMADRGEQFLDEIQKFSDKHNKSR